MASGARTASQTQVDLGTGFEKVRVFDVAVSFAIKPHMPWNFVLPKQW